MQFNRSFLKLIVLHLSLMAVVGSSVLFLFFQFLLPVLTHHGQFITVPSLKGISLEEVDACLARRSLNFEVTEEFSYAPDYPPMTVLEQYPKAGSRVKEGRKIYLTLNTKTPPKVKIPNLVDGSVRNAHVCLKSHGLLLGTIKYVPDVAQNAVLEQWHQGREIATGDLITRGSRIDLVVGAGLSNNMVEVPQVVGMKLKDAKLLLLGVGIQVGSITYESATDQAPDTILGQRPGAGQQISIGTHIDVRLATRQEEEIVTPDAPMLPEN
jgi:eukaryotic-like serine/threonine-protein kinase